MLKFVLLMFNFIVNVTKGNLNIHKALLIIANCSLAPMTLIFIYRCKGFGYISRTMCENVSVLNSELAEEMLK